MVLFSLSSQADAAGALLCDVALTEAVDAPRVTVVHRKGLQTREVPLEPGDPGILPRGKASNRGGRETGKRKVIGREE